MSEDNSNDVELMEIIEEDNSAQLPTEEAENRPIMQLFHRLISNDNKQNTVLTNAQIISILQLEFNMDINKLHDLEVDIYLNIVKKFLKDWPLWDKFDRGITSLRKQKAHRSIQNTLENKYKNLKHYLKTVIDVTRPLAQGSVSKMIEENMEKMEQVDTSQIVLEIYCTRKQLNEFVLNRPENGVDRNIFNLPDFDFNSINIANLPLESIINWWGIQVNIELKCFAYTRSTMHQLTHALVNKENGPRNLKQTLNQNVQIKDVKKNVIEVYKDQMYRLFQHIQQHFATNAKFSLLLKVLFDIIKDDLDQTGCNMKVPATYRQHSNKYPYYRKLYKEAKTEPLPGNPHDLYIEETLLPMHVFHIGKVASIDSPLPQDYTWLTIECGECKTKYTGFDLDTVMFEHFATYHMNEPDWICTNCEKSFSMIHLARNKWHHQCEI